MSITFEIVKFKKPTKDDLSNLHMLNPYGSIPILDDDGDIYIDLEIVEELKG
jgi:glutathione S-transferase